MSSAINTTNLEVRYGESVALAGVDLDIAPGTSLAVIGPNGSGKSTLLGVLAGTIEPTSGTFEVSASPPALVLQSTEVDKSLPITVRDTVALARYPSLGLFRRFGPADNKAVDDAMDRMVIGDLAGSQLHDLSGGQRQRVLVAQGLAQEADVLLLDEPVNGLDVTSQAVILDVLDQQMHDGRTVVLTTHSLDDARRCDRVLLLNTTTIAFGTPAEVLTEDHLREAFGGHFMRVGDELIVDDHHHH